MVAHEFPQHSGILTGLEKAGDESDKGTYRAS